MYNKTYYSKMEYFVRNILNIVHASNPATLFPQVSEWFNESKLPANAPTLPDSDDEL